MSSLVPDRINLSIGYRCWVSCPGCYSLFGKEPPVLSRFVCSAARFAALGIPSVTLSGGDPLLIDGLWSFLEELRSQGVLSIKLDTVGTSLCNEPPAKLRTLLATVDILSIPLDGWSEISVSWFRKGRPGLFQETCKLLSVFHYNRPPGRLYVNTVAHRLNLAGISYIFRILNSYACVDHWNVFQYMPTDQAASGASELLAISGPTFARAKELFFEQIKSESFGIQEIEFASGVDRLGKYLLVNSDGRAWVPDAAGRTICLGVIFDREEEILSAWRDTVSSLYSLTGPVRRDSAEVNSAK